MIIEPFDLRQPTKYDLVVDRLTHWYTTSREWIKKAILTDGLYVFNNPWAIQSMEKHTSYCAMIRLGMPIPATAMVPPKQYEPKADLQVTLERYARLFDLGEVGQQVGYPLFVKPYDGGGWAGVRRVDDEAELHRAYDESGTYLLHLQQAVEPHDLFIRCIGFGPQTRLDPLRPVGAAARPLHDGRRRGVRRGAPDPGRHDVDDQLVLRLGVQLVRSAAAERRVATDRLRQRLPGFAGDIAALPLPVARRRQSALVDLLRGDEAADAGQPRLVAVLRDRRLRRALRRQAGRLRRDRPAALPGGRVRGVLRHSPRPPRCRRVGVLRRRASPTGPSARRSKRCSRPRGGLLHRPVLGADPALARTSHGRRHESASCRRAGTPTGSNARSASCAGATTAGPCSCSRQRVATPRRSSGSTSSARAPAARRRAG